MLPHLLDLDPDALTRLFAEWGEPRYRAQQVSRWLLQRGVTDFEAMTDLPAALRARLAAAYRVDAPAVLASTAADDGETTKVLLGLGGDAQVETVRMRYDPDEPGERERATVCVSTQVGCAMRCVFCATGQQGFTRNLTPSEVLAQVLHFSRSERVTNVVFMGMGEPLANTHATLTAVRWLVSADGMDMRARGITISTVGLRAGIRRLAEEQLQVGLTISLHAPDDDLRHHLIPTSIGTTIDDLVGAAREYIAATGRRVTFAYALLEGVNDSPEQARVLATRIRGIQAHVNLIPYNPTAGPGLRRPSRERVRAFQRALQEAGINATVRVERGVEIAAACGQLRTDYTERQRLALA
ncbi:MAG: 23S rRNA (adenine(2503)-C(2))-methyltransferase RlmN [Dehalococcoidia bacterium]